MKTATFTKTSSGFSMQLSGWYAPLSFVNPAVTTTVNNSGSFTLLINGQLYPFKIQEWEFTINSNLIVDTAPAIAEQLNTTIFPPPASTGGDGELPDNYLIP